MTVRETLAEGKKRLEAPSPSSRIDTPGLDAALLWAEVLGASQAELIVRGNETAAEGEREEFFRLLERRRSGECVAYILGRKEFRGLEFAVNPRVLVPRPDTETLVEAALECIDRMAGKGEKSLSLLDLCTGSGAVAISLKNERPFIEATGSDISPQALEMAVLNAARLLEGEPYTVRFIRSDLFRNIPDKFDIIVSNPPYIPSKEIAALAPEVRGEPRIALDGGEDGLAFIRKIVAQSKNFLLPRGVLLLEAGPEQMPKLRALFAESGFGGVAVRKDLAGRDRAILGTAR